MRNAGNAIIETTIPNQYGGSVSSMRGPNNGPIIWATLSKAEESPLILPCSWGDTVWLILLFIGPRVKEALKLINKKRSKRVKIFVEKPTKKKQTRKIDKPKRIALSSPSFLIVGLKRVNLIPVRNIPDVINKIEMSIGVRFRTLALKKEREDITIVKEVVWKPQRTKI